MHQKTVFNPTKNQISFKVGLKTVLQIIDLVKAELRIHFSKHQACHKSL
jgi:hypothetical protein